jgi:hypothetical protein
LWLSIIVFVGCWIWMSLKHLKWWIFAIFSCQNSMFHFTLTHFKMLQEDHLNCQQSTVYSLLLQWRHLYGWLVCLALVGTENGISIMDHGAWKALPRRYIFLCKESVIEAWRNAYYMEMFFFHVIGYPYLWKHIVILEKDVPYDQ